MFTNSIDWMQFSLPEGCKPEDTIQELSQYHDNCDFVQSDRGQLGYENQFIGLNNAMVLTSEHRKEHHVILPGKFCRSVGYLNMTDIAAWAINQGAKFTRLDLAADDYSKFITPDKVAASIEANEKVTKCTTINRLYSMTERTGDTIYVGAASSGKRLRIYDKGAESKGEIDCVRWEMQMRDEFAQSAIEQLLSTTKPEDKFASLLLTFIDFRENNGDKCKARRPRVYWWHHLVGDILKAKFNLPVVQQTMAKIEGWIRKQVAPSIACLLQKTAGDLSIFGDIAIEGRERWRSSHREAMAAAGI